MKFKVDGTRRVALCASLLALALLGSCGGGGQVTRYVPARVLAFGDETSVINADDHSKYSVNALATGSTTTLDCAANPLWIQHLASAYALVFPECNPANVAAPASFIYAKNAARAGDLAAQIDLHLSSSGLSASDLATVLVGANDIIAQYQLYPGVSEAQLSANLEQAGAALAAQVNRLAGLGAKVLVSTAPDIGLTPYALAQNSSVEAGRGALLSRLSASFNSAMRKAILNDGRKIGLVLADELVQSIVKNVTVVKTYVNVTQAACSVTVALRACTTTTVVTDPTTHLLANGATWLWADDRHIGPGAQASLGALAASRAAGNPF